MRLNALLIAALAVLPPAASADALSAAQAREALARGALAWDVRAGAAVTALLPGAVRPDLRRWAHEGSMRALEQAVSAAGIDLSRDVVLYGAAGDPLAQALVASLARVATGPVHWFVGGIDEWRAAGLPTVAEATTRLPVPQHLVARPEAQPFAAPAAATLRQTAPATVIASRG